MRVRLRENWVALAAATAAACIIGWLTLIGWALTDYDVEARPSLDALVHGHLLRFFQLAPAYGGSLVIRAPFVLATKLWGGGELSIYRAAVAPCLAASVVLAVWLVARMRAAGHGRGARAIVLALCVANPLTLPALEIGHPEELLGAVLCVAAVLMAMDNRAIWAGVLLGLAIANKEWALLAVGPVVIALPAQRLRALVTAAGVAAAILAPLVLLGAFLARADAAATQATVIFNPWQVWWFLGGHVHTLRDASGHIIAGHRWDHRVEPEWVGVVSHPLIVALSLPLTALCSVLRSPMHHRASRGLLLLTLLLLLRCVLDPWNLSYYCLPFLLALLAWESSSATRPPVVSLAATFLAWFVLQWAAPAHGFSPDMQSLLFDVITIPALGALSLALYAPGQASELAARLARRAPLASPA
jgi:hypothetical protein